MIFLRVDFEKGTVRRLETKHKNSIAAGATVLIAANFIVKIIGVVYKIPLANILGSDGMGYLSSAYEIYQLLLTIFASGGAVAISKMVAESIALARYAEVRKEVRLMGMVFFIVGGLGTAVMFFGSGFFARSVSTEQAKYCMMVLSPAIFFLSMSCVFRGYYQGMQNMKPTGITQIVEAFFKLLIGIGFALLLKSMAYPEEHVAAGAISGTSFSTMIGTVILLCVFFSPKNRRELHALTRRGGKVRSKKAILRQFVHLAVPLTMSAMVVNLTGVLDLFLIYKRLEDSGLDKTMANAAYGGYKGYAQTLFNLPPSIISSLNVSIIPALSAAFVAKNDRRVRYLLRRVIKLVIALAMPCAVGLLVLAGPIQRMLFPARLDEIEAVTPLLQILGVASFWTCLSTLSTAMLQSIGKMRVPVYSLISGGIVKLTVNYILIGIPSIGMIGAPIGTLLCYITIFTINFICFRKDVQCRISLSKVVLKPVIASVLMGFVGYYAQKLGAGLIGDAKATALAVCLAAAVYGVVMLAIGGISEKDILMLPKGQTMVRLLKKMHLLHTKPAQ